MYAHIFLYVLRPYSSPSPYMGTLRPKDIRYRYTEPQGFFVNQLLKLQLCSLNPKATTC